MPSHHRSPFFAGLTRFAAVGLALPIAISLAGCRSAAPEAQVRLHNDAPHAVSARIVHIGVTNTKTVMRRTLGPGATDTLGPLPTPERGSLQLVLEPADRIDFILTAPVPSGLTAYHVDRPFSMARLELDPQAINPDWTFTGGFLADFQLQAIAEYEAAPSAQRRADADFGADMDLLDQP